MQPQRELGAEASAAIVARVVAAPQLQTGLWDAGLPIFPAEILENLAVGEPARRCWMVLWRWAGCKPDYVKCDAGSLMSALGARDKRTVRGYRDQLASLGVISIVDDGARWVLYVNDPAEVSADRPRLKTAGRYRYLAFMGGEVADDEAGSFCAKAPAVSPADQSPGSFCAKTPAPEIIEFGENLRRRQAEERDRVARETPPPVGDELRLPQLALARSMQERSNVPNVLGLSAHQDVPKNVLGNVENEEAEKHAGNVSTAERLMDIRQELLQKLGEIEHGFGWQPWAIVASRQIGLVSEGDVATIVEKAIADGRCQWAYVWGAVKLQLRDRGADACTASGLFLVTDPTMPSFKALRRWLRDRGIVLDRDWRPKSRRHSPGSDWRPAGNAGS